MNLYMGTVTWIFPGSKDGISRTSERNSLSPGTSAMARSEALFTSSSCRLVARVSTWSWISFTPACTVWRIAARIAASSTEIFLSVPPGPSFVVPETVAIQVSRTFLFIASAFSLQDLLVSTIRPVALRKRISTSRAVSAFPAGVCGSFGSGSAGNTQEIPATHQSFSVTTRPGDPARGS